jgi:hypothetical protein
MTQEKIISGNEDEIWQQITADFIKEDDLLEYRVVIEQQNRRILLDIDIDLGGGFEGGFESTMLRSQLKSIGDFRFAIHNESFIDEVGKFFGMQDVVIGYPEFDKKVLIKANDETKVRPLFSETSIREVFQSLDDFTFGIIMHHFDGKEKSPCLELYINSAITDAVSLRKIYSAFFKVLILIDPH